ncbi:bifunctional serine/threonine-protein kinase/universal stress protein [Ideonella sp.]|uniref:serine/threonine protein kinase n=1 Tax=Ideonella sp. TaxID=1929293 RepID=UPI002B4967F2|nr:bifunctional serine/threonine-protein kinase/universal stress protein [Ideonella sp.]HJV70316.1 bifunctional serine/threonine-protein kinase/universal stress protein [Ideonella sp.]
MANSPTGEPLREGDEVDGFRLGRRLHLGGMAAVHRLVGPRGPLPLIMKIPRLGIGESASNVISFEVERMVLGVLSGPHVPTLVCTGDVETRPYLVMEYVEGPPLEDWVARAPLPAQEVARLGAAVAAALHELHKQDVVHLDLKPANVLMRPDGSAVLIDFGLAHHSRFPDLLAEEFRMPVGNWPYMAPEQIMGVRCDPRSDVYALGAILYELTTGRLPFGLPKSIRRLRQRLSRDPVPPRALVPTTPEWLQEITLRCLSVQAVDRYASAAQIAFDLSHHDQVAITERGRRLRPAGWRVRLRRWLWAAGFEPGPCPPPSVQVNAAPIVVVAIATTHTDEAVFEALRDATRRLVAAENQCRIACVTVTPPEPALGAERIEDAATSVHIRHLVQLRHWAKPLQLPEDRLTFHVIESNAPAAALIDYARVNKVDQILIGAPLSRGLTPWRGRIATQVMAEASCSVTVVRPRAGAESPVE